MNLGYSKLDDAVSRSITSSGRETSPTNGWTIDQTTGKVTATFTAGLDLKGNSLENVSRILSANGRWSIDEDGKLMVREVEAEKGMFTKKLNVGTPENPQGITLFDPTGNPYCVRIETGGAAVSTLGECGSDSAAPPPPSAVLGPQSEPAPAPSDTAVSTTPTPEGVGLPTAQAGAPTGSVGAATTTTP